MGIPARILEADPFTIGAAARLLYSSANERGTVQYQLERRRERLACFGEASAGTEYAILDLGQVVAFFKPPDSSIVALGAYLPQETRIYLFDESWGVILDKQGRKKISATVSIGIATYPQHCDTSESIFRCADSALYKAKQLGRNRTQVWDSKNNQE